MKRRLTLLGATFLLVAVAAGTALVESEADVAKSEIRSLIEASYINGAFNDLDTETMREGFHPTFRINGVQEGGLRQLPIDDWIAGIEKRKASPAFDPADQKWDHRFALIDVTESAAIAKIELFKDSEHIYTDYLSLLKFADGWKITDKVYHRHPDS